MHSYSRIGWAILKKFIFITKPEQNNHLGNEIESLKRQKVTLAKKMKDEAVAHREWKQARARPPPPPVVPHLRHTHRGLPLYLLCESILRGLRFTICVWLHSHSQALELTQLRRKQQKTQWQLSKVTAKADKQESVRQAEAV